MTDNDNKSSSHHWGCWTPFIIAMAIAGTIMAARIRGWPALFLVCVSLFLFYYSIGLLVGKLKKNKIGNVKNSDGSPTNKTAYRREPLRKKEIKTILTARGIIAPDLVMPLLYSLHSRQSGVPELAYQSLLKVNSPAAVDPLLDVLDLQDTKIVDTSIEVLGEIGDVKALPRLLKLAEEPAHKQVPSPYPHLERTLEKIRRNMLANDDDYLCGSCYLRYKEYHFCSKTHDSYRFYACRFCGGDGFGIPAIERVILYMNSRLKEAYSIDNRIIYVNWLKIKKPFDFDEVEVIDVQESDLEELVMILRNDMDDKRRAALHSKPLTISGNINLSPAKRNLLNDNFKLQE